MSYHYADLSPSEIIDLLRQWREGNERRSEDIINMFTAIGNDSFIEKLGNEKYVIKEQLIYAALDCHCLNIAKMAALTFTKDFSESNRAWLYNFLVSEAEEKYDTVLMALNNTIKFDETYTPARKRRVAILKAQGLINEAIKELVDYLKKFMSDVEAWQELSELYLQVQEYSKAAFCVEELILHSPHNHLMHQRLADIRYTMGGADNMELAKSYYCQALKLNPDNMRALLGLLLTTNNLLNHYKSSGSSKRKEVYKLCQWVQSEILKKQMEAKSSALPLADIMLNLAICD